MHLQGAEFQASAKKEGAKAGEAAGSAMSKGISGALGKLKLGASFVQGLGIGAGIGALHALEDAVSSVINVIPDMIHQGQDFAKTVDDISDATGSGAESASRFAAAMIYTTGSAAGVSMGLKTLSKDLVANRAEFEKLGISITDANGAPRDTLAILEDVREFMATKLPAGYAKSALAIKLFGRSGLDFLDFLSMSNEQVGKFNSTVDAMGVTLSGPAVAAAESLAREQNLLGLAWQGLANTLTTAVVPAIREAIGGLTQFIVEHGAEIKQTLVDITQAALGFVAGLVGIQGVTPFQSTLDGLASSGSGAALTFDRWAVSTGRTIPKLDKATSSTKGATDAIDKQIKSVEKAIEVEKKRDDASETIFQRTMRRLSAEYGAQLDALDLAEKQIAIADRRRDLNQQLNDAQLALADAQSGKAGGVDAKAVSDAMATIADIQAQQAENERRLAVDTQRDRLQAVKDYIENVAQIEEQADNKKALASTLEKRRIKLTAELATAVAEKDATAQTDINARLEAVKTAEARTQTAIRNGDKQSELEKLKGQLEDQRKAIASAGSGTSSDNKKLLAQMKADYQKYLDSNVTATKENVNFIGALVIGNTKGGTGIGGALTKAFADGQAAGESFRKWMTDQLLPAVQKIADGFGLIVDALAAIADNADLIERLARFAGSAGTTDNPLSPQPSREDVATANKLTKEFVLKYENQHLGSDPTEAQIRAYLHEKGVKGFAAGGPARAHVPILVGERRPEVFVPSERGTIMPSTAGWGGTSGGTEINIYTEMDGEQLERLVTRRTENKRRR